LQHSRNRRQTLCCLSSALLLHMSKRLVFSGLPLPLLVCVPWMVGAARCAVEPKTNVVLRRNVRTLSVMTSDGTADKPRLLFRLRLTAAKVRTLILTSHTTAWVVSLVVKLSVVLWLVVHGCEQLGAAAQGQSHPQQAITQFARDADREALLQRLAGTASQDLPRAVSEVAVSHEDAAGETAPARKPGWVASASLHAFCMAHNTIVNHANDDLHH
jgi:hypothetical protein